MPSLDDVLTAVCRLPIDFERGGVSAIVLIRQSGYLALRREVIVERLSECLTKDPGLVDAWIKWSEDNRSGPAWYISTLGPREFEVAYLDHGRSSQHRRFDDKVCACAEYVSHELEHRADLAEMSPWAVIRSVLSRRGS
jgi:hypothetical protein